MELFDEDHDELLRGELANIGRLATIVRRGGVNLDADRVIFFVLDLGCPELRFVAAEALGLAVVDRMVRGGRRSAAFCLEGEGAIQIAALLAPEAVPHLQAWSFSGTPVLVLDGHAVPKLAVLDIPCEEPT